MASIVRPAMMIYLIAVLVYFSWKIISEEKDKLVNVLLAASYISGAEVYLRMTKAYFIWETGKYAVIWFCLLGMIYIGFKRNAVPYLIYFLLLLPGILIAYEEIAYDVNFRKSILFNFSGPLCLTVAAVFVFGKTVTFPQMLRILDYMIYPLITTTVYVVLYSPDVREVVTGRWGLSWDWLPSSPLRRSPSPASGRTSPCRRNRAALLWTRVSRVRTG